MTTIQAVLKSFVRNEEGATMVEYALMLALIAIVCIGAVTVIGTSADGVFGASSTALVAAP